MAIAPASIAPTYNPAPTGNPPQPGDAAQAGSGPLAPFAGPLRVNAAFCPPADEVADPFDTVSWEVRSSSIKDENGKVLFEQTNCEVPSFWSQLATNVICSKYFYGEVGTPQREYSVRQLIHRVTRTIADWGIQDGYFASAEDGERFYRDLTWLCLHQHGAFNSPVWFNVGLHHQYGVTGARCNWRWDAQTQSVVQPENPYEYPQGSACFIQSVADNMEDIMRLATSEAMLFKFGSGTGTDLSTLRSKREKLSGGGTPSGPLSFMRVYDQIAAVVKSGGKTRRAAKMQSIKVWHPDVMEFIECKWREEQKAQTLIASGKYEANFNGEAYSSVMFQNANLSVRLTDDFMAAYERGADWKTRWVTDNTVEGPTYKARDVMSRMAECAWHCGDPGVQYDTTINRWHTCPASGRINASNPCSEYMFLDDTACNLASVNLMKFVRRQDDFTGASVDGAAGGGAAGTFDHDRYAAACRLFFIAQEILVDHASYPTDKIAANSHRFRPLGLGYANLGSLLMSSGLPYDSEEGRGVCGAITAIMHGTANLTSAELAEAVGPFDGYAENREPMNRVMQMHREAVVRIDARCPEYLRRAAQRVWDRVVVAGERHGFRNAQATVLAPTGTISFMMDCDTTGIEPDIALVKYKQLAGGGMLKIVNQTVPRALEKLGYGRPEVESILAHIDREDTIEGASDLRPEHLAVFDCAFTPAGGTRSIPWRAHVTMMAAAQPFLSGAISKTVNMPRDTTPDEIAQAYYDGWKLGLKALAIYRDGSKDSQPLNTKLDGKKGEAEALVAKPRRERLPDTRRSLTHKFSVAGHEGYITVGMFEDGRPGELFITMAKEGSTIGGLMDAFGTSVSMSLQYGVPLEDYVRKFSHMRFEPQGHTKNPDIRIAKSLIDYIFRWLGITFLPGYKEATQGQPIDAGSSAPSATGGPPAEEPGQSSPVAKKADGPAAGQGANAVAAIGHAANGHTANGHGANGHATNGHATNGHTANGHGSNGHGTGAGKPAGAVAAVYSPKLLERAGAILGEDSRNEQFARFQVDAPACDNCGAITVRNGNCYLCHNCGASMGCS